MEMYTEDEIRAKMKQQCEGDRQRLLADEIGLSPSFISLILSGQRGISADTASRLGYERRVIYTPVAPRTAAAQQGAA